MVCQFLMKVDCGLWGGSVQDLVSWGEKQCVEGGFLWFWFKIRGGLDPCVMICLWTLELDIVAG